MRPSITSQHRRTQSASALKATWIEGPAEAAGAKGGSFRQHLRTLVLIGGAVVLAGCGGLHCQGSDIVTLQSRLRLSLSPSEPTLGPGGDMTLTVTATEVNPSEFPVEGVQMFRFPDIPAIDVQPNEFSLDFTGVTEASTTVTLTVSESASPGIKEMNVYWGDFLILEKWGVTVTGMDYQPD